MPRSCKSCPLPSLPYLMLGSTFSWLLCFCYTVHLSVTQTSNVFSCLWTSVHVFSSDDFTSLFALFELLIHLYPGIFQRGLP